MVNNFILFILVALLFPNENSCKRQFIDYNQNSLNNQLLHIKGYFNTTKTDSVNVFIDKNSVIKIILDYRIIIIDTSKTINYNALNKQLFIDKPDPFLSNWLNSNNDFQLIDYFFNNEHLIDHSKLFFNNDCSVIDSLKLISDQFNINIYDISIDSLNVDDSDIFFKLNIDEKNVFKYDFR